jgi:hypothetical protein
MSAVQRSAELQTAVFMGNAAKSAALPVASSADFSHRYKLISQQLLEDVHLHSLCGNNNHALFGSCLASSGKRLEILQGKVDSISPGLPFSLSAWKVDFYNQTVTSDSSTFLKIQSRPSSNGTLLAAVVSGDTVFQLDRGCATVTVAVTPYIAAIDAGAGFTHLAGEVAVYAEGIDDHSSSMLW